MAIVVYPADDWNSFVSLVDMGTGLTELGSATSWDALDTTAQEVMLVRGAAILTAVTEVGTDCNLPQAQILLTQADLANSGKYLTAVVTDQPYIDAKVGSLAVTYNLKPDGKPDLPFLVVSMLGSCYKYSSIPMTRGFSV